MFGPGTHTESDVLVGFLDSQLSSIRAAAHGLSEQQARETPCRSTLSVGGLIKHATYVLRQHLHRRSGAEIVLDEAGYALFMGSFALGDDETLAGALEAFDEARGHYLDDVRACDPDEPVTAPPAPWDGINEPTKSVLRFDLVHQIEEFARHAGHADIVREQLDGADAASLLMAVEGREGNDFVQPWGTPHLVTPDYPAWFFDRDDSSPDPSFYRSPRFVTHIDDAAIEAVGALYAELGVDRPDVRVLDLMSSWVSHLRSAPREVVALGLNAAELDANPMATERLVQDLNVDPRLPFPDASFDAVLCCVSIDYLTHPVDVLAEAARVLRPGAPVVVTFSNRCFPTKAVHAWLATDDAGRCALVIEHLRRAGGLEPAVVTQRTPADGYRGDPLFAVVARRQSMP